MVFRMKETTSELVVMEEETPEAPDEQEHRRFWDSLGPSLKDHAAVASAALLAPARSAASVDAMGGQLPTLNDMADWFGQAAPAPSRHGLNDRQAKACILQLCGCDDGTIAAIVGVGRRTVGAWTQGEGWRAFQRDCLDHCLTRLVGLAHLSIAQRFLYTEDEKERVKLAKWVLDTAGVHKSPVQEHHHVHEHAVRRASDKEALTAKTLDGMETPVIGDDNPGGL
jgi:hypothetical protein